MHDDELRNSEPHEFDKTETAGASDTKRVIDRYTLLQKIGEGGMGEVWLADQSQPIRRRVAVKIIKLGMDTKHVIARFEAERQALALMNHPCIARVLDAGATPEGRPYFVMEFVSGLAINDYCDRHHLSTNERLKLFRKVCEGVQHAHQKAIIHRDLKPSNILVTEQDGQAIPKIIDFGLAKATAQSLTDKTMVTQFGMLVGTPEYMSPEQADLTTEDIDIRTDVYSLGVVLYNILTGSLPFTSEDLRGAGLDGIREVIRNRQPQKPSTRLSNQGERSEETAKLRKVSPKVLLGELSGDLDWITMKTLEKDRTRRYNSVQALADDIDYYLTNKPVTARPPSKLYEMRRFASRHRVVVIACLLVFIALAAGGTMAGIGFVKASRARSEAEAEARKSAKVAQFLYSMLEDSNPFGTGSADLTVKDIILRALPRIDEELAGELDVQGMLRYRLGNAFFGLGDFEQSISLLKQSMKDFGTFHGGINSESEWVRHQLCWVVQKHGDYDEVISLAKVGAKNSRALLGDNSELEVRFLDVMGDTYRYKGELEPAERILKQAYQMLDTMVKDSANPAGNDIELNLNNNYALVLQASGKLEEAETIFRTIYAKNLAERGEVHPMTQLFMSNLAHTLLMEGKYDEAETWFRRVIEARTRVLGPDHPFTKMDVAGLEKVLAKTNPKK